MWEELFSRITKKKISLEVDPLLFPHTISQEGAPDFLEITLFDLIIAIGIGKTRRITKKIKFADSAEFLERFIKDDNNLKIKIMEDVDDKIGISKEIGEGLSIILSEKLFGVKRSSISKISRRGESKPDFEGFTVSNKKIVWESKGTTTNNFSNGTINHAINQKRKVDADASFVSLSYLKENSTTKVKLIDPPTLPLSGSELEKALVKVKHYVDTFNFIGQSEIAKYFRLVSKRLKNDTNFAEFGDKTSLFEEIKSTYPFLQEDGRLFYGNIEKLSEDKYIFVGFDQKLLSVFNLLEFEEYREDYSFVTNRPENKFFVSRDGICYGLLKNLSGLERVDSNKIKNYKENISISDVDDMYKYEIYSLIEYYLKKENISISKEVLLEPKIRADGIIEVKNSQYIIEIKSNNIIKGYDFLKKIINKNDIKNGILITRKKISNDDISEARNNKIVIIDRERLKKIIRGKRKISSYLKN